MKKLMLVGIAMLAGPGLAGEDLDPPVDLPRERIEAAAQALQAPGDGKAEGGWLRAAGWALAGLAAGYGVAWADDKGWLEGVGGKKRQKKEEASHLTPPQHVNVEVSNSGEGDTAVTVNIGKVWRALCGR